ncbi:MAG: cyclic nucleotide-binding domain-containing protein [Desulfobacterales bacterium]|nr:cyclic nucleotide-binding domain-containing protein [Desulfobacterales bacterium]
MTSIEKQVLELVETGQRDKAIKLLFKLIVKSAENNDFDKAEKLRQTLIKTDSMALDEITRSGEILEENKFKAIDPSHKKHWRKLYREFSPEEAIEFYYSLKTINIKPGQIIIQQGKLNDKLFFINQGKLKSICKSETSEFFLKETSAGEACGLSTFFLISTATTSVIADTEANISYINQKALSNITEKLSGFDSKLQELCKGLVRINSADVIKKQGIERRQHPRLPVKGTVVAHLIEADGKPSERPFHGAFDDLSIGGASFTIKSSTQEYARSLLGSKAIIKLTLKNSKNESVGTKKGWIVGLCDHLFNDYLISFRFNTPLSRKVLHHLVKGSN